MIMIHIKLLSKFLSNKIDTFITQNWSYMNLINVLILNEVVDNWVKIYVHSLFYCARFGTKCNTKNKTNPLKRSNFKGFNYGPYKIRTSDLHDVNVAL